MKRICLIVAALPVVLFGGQLKHEISNKKKSVMTYPAWVDQNAAIPLSQQMIPGAVLKELAHTRLDKRMASVMYGAIEGVFQRQIFPYLRRTEKTWDATLDQLVFDGTLKAPEGDPWYYLGPLSNQYLDRAARSFETNSTRIAQIWEAVREHIHDDGGMWLDWQTLTSTEIPGQLTAFPNLGWKGLARDAFPSDWRNNYAVKLDAIYNGDMSVDGVGQLYWSGRICNENYVYNSIMPPVGPNGILGFYSIGRAVFDKWEWTDREDLAKYHEHGGKRVYLKDILKSIAPGLSTTPTNALDFSTRISLNHFAFINSLLGAMNLQFIDWSADGGPYFRFKQSEYVGEENCSMSKRKILGSISIEGGKITGVEADFSTGAENATRKTVGISTNSYITMEPFSGHRLSATASMNAMGSFVSDMPMNMLEQLANHIPVGNTNWHGISASYYPSHDNLDPHGMLVLNISSNLPMAEVSGPYRLGGNYGTSFDLLEAFCKVEGRVYRPGTVCPYLNRCPTWEDWNSLATSFLPERPHPMTDPYIQKHLFNVMFGAVVVTNPATIALFDVPASRFQDVVETDGYALIRTDSAEAVGAQAISSAARATVGLLPGYLDALVIGPFGLGTLEAFTGAMAEREIGTLINRSLEKASGDAWTCAFFGGSASVRRKNNGEEKDSFELSYDKVVAMGPPERYVGPITTAVGALHWTVSGGYVDTRQIPPCIVQGDVECMHLVLQWLFSAIGYDRTATGQN